MSRRLKTGRVSRFAQQLTASSAVAVILATGCGHHHHPVQVSRQQTAPPPPAAYPPQTAESQQPRPPARIPVTPVPPGGVSDADLDFVNTHRPILSETGRATWYTAPYKGRKAANGEVFSDSALTAAHRTLPMGSLVTVTNLRTGQSAAMRITDRGPFVVVDGVACVSRSVRRRSSVVRDVSSVRLTLSRNFWSLWVRKIRFAPRKR